MSTVFLVCTQQIWFITGFMRTFRLYRRCRHLSNYNFDFNSTISVGRVHYGDGMQPKFGDDMQPKFSELMLHYFGDAHTINLIVGYSDISGMVRSYWRHYRFIKMDTIFTVLHHLKLTTGSHDHGIQLNPGDSYTILNQIDLDVGRTILHFTATNARPLRHIAFQIKMGMTVEIELAPCGYIKELTIKDSNRIQTDSVVDMSLIKSRQSIFVIDQAMQTNGNKPACAVQTKMVFLQQGETARLGNVSSFVLDLDKVIYGFIAALEAGFVHSIRTNCDQISTDKIMDVNATAETTVFPTYE